MGSLIRGFASRRVRLVAGGGLLLLGVTLAAAAQTLPGRLLEGSELYCEVARGSFERTGKWARELASTLEALDAEGPDVTATRLLAIRQGLEQEVVVLDTHPPPHGAEEVYARGTATVSLLIDVADPTVVRLGEDAREQAAVFIRDQFVAARGEARAAAAALRQHEPNCPTRRSNGVLQLLGLGSQGGPASGTQPRSTRAGSWRLLNRQRSGNPVTGPSERSGVQPDGHGAVVD